MNVSEMFLNRLGSCYGRDRAIMVGPGGKLVENRCVVCISTSNKCRKKRC